MGANSSRTRYGFDTEAGVVLRDVADGAETTSPVSETAVDLGALNAAYWQGGEAPHGTFVVCIHVTAAAPYSTNSDEVYAFTLRIDDVAAMNNTPITVASLTLPQDAETGFYTLNVDSKVLDQLHTDNSSGAMYMDITLTQSGTAETITYGAWIADFIRG